MLICTLKQVLLDKELSQASVAEAMGCTRSYISKVANNKTKIGSQKLDDFCRALGCQPGDLLKWVPDKAKSPQP